MKRSLRHSVPVILVTILFLGCKKNKDDDASIFYGKWKASYGDTIVFNREAGKDMITYDLSMNPAFMPNGHFQYVYSKGKLGIKDNPASTLNPPRILQSFTWLEPGKSFRVQGVEWFLFISSTQTYFTFTKIP